MTKRHVPEQSAAWMVTRLSKSWADAAGVAGTGYEPLAKYGVDQWNLGDVSELDG